MAPRDTTTPTGPPDGGGDARWQIAKAIVGINLLVMIGYGFCLYQVAAGHGDQVTHDPYLWAAWTTALGPLLAASTLALRLLVQPNRPHAWRTTAWASALFTAGVLMIAVTSTIRDRR
jgi:hypothetical protein